MKTAGGFSPLSILCYWWDKERLVWGFGSPRRRVVVLRLGSISSTARTMLEEKKRRGVKKTGGGRKKGGITMLNQSRRCS